MTVKEFVNKFYPYAEKAGKELNVNPIFILAHWGHETGWTENYAHNLAGIGAFDDPRKRQTPYGYAYASYWDFVNAYVDLIKRRYKEAVGATSMTEFATALKAGGWATDSAYVQKLVSVYNSISGVKPEPIPAGGYYAQEKRGPIASPVAIAGGAIILAVVLAAGVALVVAGGLKNA